MYLYNISLGNNKAIAKNIKQIFLPKTLYSCKKHLSVFQSVLIKVDRKIREYSKQNMFQFPEYPALDKKKWKEGCVVKSRNEPHTIKQVRFVIVIKK